MLTCHLRLTRPSGQRESFHLGEDWEEGLRLASPGRLARIVGAPGGVQAGAEFLGTVCPQLCGCAFAVQTVEKRAAYGWKGQCPQFRNFLFQLGYGGSLAEFYISSSALVNRKVV